MNKLGAFHTFVVAADQGSFTAAARKLGTSASTVTKIIGRLEDNLGVRLFNRTSRHLILTEQGQTFLERAQKIVADVSEAEGLVRETTGALRGSVRLVVPKVFGRLTLMPALPEFFARYPEVDVQVHVSDRPLDLIEAGFDCGVYKGELKDSSLIRRELMQVAKITAASPDYLARHGVPKVPEDLHEHNCICGRFGRDWTYRSAQGGRQRIRVSGNLSVFHADTLREAAVQGLGIIHSTSWSLKQDIEQGRLREILSDYAIEKHALSVIYPAGKHLPARVRAMADYLIEITSPKVIKKRRH
jgi:DNA-binding transcriptional LysR family regulator